MKDEGHSAISAQGTSFVVNRAFIVGVLPYLGIL
jgi:hypothetical protein